MSPSHENAAYPTLETLAATALLREHLADLRVRVINVVDAGVTSTRARAAAEPTTTTRATVATTRPVEPTTTASTRRRPASPGRRTRRWWTRLLRSGEHVRAGARRRGS
jgi:hypothetical protein